MELKAQVSMDGIALPSHFFQQVVEQAPLAISISDLDANIVYCNASFCRITGYQLEQVIGLNHKILSYKTTPKHIYQNLWHHLQNGQRWQGTLVNRRADGKRYIADVVIAPLLNEQQQVTHYMSMQRDITLEHEMSLRITNQKRLVEQVLNDMPSAVVLLNPRGHVILDNLAYKTLQSDFKSDPFQLIWQQWQQLYPNQRLADFARQHHEYAFTTDLSIRGGTRWLSCRLSALAIDNDSADHYFSQQFEHHWVCTLSEKTREIQRGEQQRIKQLQLLLTESDMLCRLQETLSAAIHQMQGPMNVLDAALGVLNKRNQPCAGSGAITMALTSGNEALSCLQKALPQRRSEAFQSVNLNALLQDVLSALNEQLIKQSIDIDWQPERQLPNMIAQPMRLRCAFKQLIENAVEAIARTPHAERLIKIISQVHEDGLQVDIIDTGIGIQSDEHIKIFQPFYSHKSHPDSAGAYGIGLSIVQQILNDHTATISVQTPCAQGAHFIVQFPLKHDLYGSPL